MRVKPIKDIDTALRVYYQYPEIGNREIIELFGSMSCSTIARYKKAVMKKQIEKEIKTSLANTVNTKTAYEVWGIDVDDLEKRRNKLNKLGLLARGGEAS